MRRSIRRFGRPAPFLPVLGRAALCLGALGLSAAGLGGCATYEGASLYQRGTAELDRGQPILAIADLERAATLVPESSEIQNHLGLAYAAAGRDRDALSAFRRAVALDCDNAAARANLAAAERPR